MKTDAADTPLGITNVDLSIGIYTVDIMRKRAFYNYFLSCTLINELFIKLIIPYLIVTLIAYKYKSNTN